MKYKQKLKSFDQLSNKLGFSEPRKERQDRTEKAIVPKDRADITSWYEEQLKKQGLI